MSKKTNWSKLLTITAALAGLGAAAVYVVKVLREKGEDVDAAIDDLLDLYSSKAAELDKLVHEVDYRVAN